MRDPTYNARNGTSTSSEAAASHPDTPPAIQETLDALDGVSLNGDGADQSPAKTAGEPSGTAHGYTLGPVPPLIQPGGIAIGWNTPMAPMPMMMQSPAMPVSYSGFSPSPAHLSADYGTPPAPPPAMVPVGRTVYVGNLPIEATVDELLDLVKFGPIENVRLLPEKSCAFISFLTGQVAAAFHADSTVRHISLHGQELKIGWGKPSVPPVSVLYAVQHQQASRNVYIGQLDPHTTEQDLHNELSRFGPIDQIKIVRDQNVGFVHFLSIQTAMTVVATLPNEPAWAGKPVNYGKDRCAYVPKGQQQIQAHNHQAAALGLATATWLGYPTGYMNYGQAPIFSGSGSNARNTQGDGEGSSRGPIHAFGGIEPQFHQFGNRTVYLGNLHPETSAEDICNHVRGGILQAIRYMPDRHIAFVTFVDHNAALTFFHMALMSGITIHSRRLKIGWGKPSGPLSPALALAVQTGASRNVYLGNIQNQELINEAKIRADLSQYGELEMVNTLRERNCAFANFTNLQSAIKCIEGLKYHKDYQTVKIAYGKDRCGNPPRYLEKLVMNWSSSATSYSGEHRPPSESLSEPSQSGESERDLGQSIT